VVAVGGIIIKQLDPEFFINGQQFWGLAMLASSVVYVVVSLVSNRSDFNMDKMLHRGGYAVQGETRIVSEAPSRGLKVLGMGKELRGATRLSTLPHTWTLPGRLSFLSAHGST
jgi:hypothetical protein